MSRHRNTPESLRLLRIAYADTFEEGYPHGRRCLEFMLPEWFPADVAVRACHLIGEYGAFTPEDAIQSIRQIDKLASEAWFAVGREGSPVLYIETTAPEQAVSAFGKYAHPTEADVLDPDDPIGNAKEYNDPHRNCYHEEFDIDGNVADSRIPCPIEHWPERDEEWRSDSLGYVRVWWDG